MIKRAKNNKKKGFTLIELIIVLAVMAIIALIAIPNFLAVKEQSKIKTDKESCTTMARTTKTYLSSDTITLGATPTTSTIKITTGGVALVAADVTGSIPLADAQKLSDAFKGTAKPQEKGKNAYKITITVAGDGEITVTADTIA